MEGSAKVQYGVGWRESWVAWWRQTWSRRM